jgi:hypothetical protein
VETEDGTKKVHAAEAMASKTSVTVSSATTHTKEISNTPTAKKKGVTKQSRPESKQERHKTYNVRQQVWSKDDDEGDTKH